MEEITRAVRFVLNANILEINSSLSSATCLLPDLASVLNHAERQRISNKEQKSCKQDAVEMLVDILGKKDGAAFLCFLRALITIKKDKLVHRLVNHIHPKVPRGMQAQLDQVIQETSASPYYQELHPLHYMDFPPLHNYLESCASETSDIRTTEVVRSVLNENMSEICTLSSAEGLLPDLIDILTDTEIQRISTKEQQHSTQDAVMMLVDILCSKNGAVAFIHFVKALHRNKNNTLVDKLVNLLYPQVPRDMQAALHQVKQETLYAEMWRQ